MTTACMEDIRQLQEKERAAGKQTMEGHMVLEDIIQPEANRQVEDNIPLEDNRHPEVKGQLKKKQTVYNNTPCEQLKARGQKTVGE